MPVSGEAATAYATAATTQSVPAEALTARTKRRAGPSVPGSSRAHTDTTASAMPGAKNTPARGSQVFRYGR